MQMPAASSEHKHRGLDVRNIPRVLPLAGRSEPRKTVQRFKAGYHGRLAEHGIKPRGILPCPVGFH